jgi:hypothetical protein
MKFLGLLLVVGAVALALSACGTREMDRAVPGVSIAALGSSQSN